MKYTNCLDCGKNVSSNCKSGYCKSCCSKGKPKSSSHKESIARSKIGNKNGVGKRKFARTLEHKKRIADALRGKKLSPERIEIQIRNRRGENSHFWKGGVTNMNKIARGSYQYSLWRTSVFERDKYTCVFCGVKSIKGVKVILNADHIKPFALYPELRFDTSNGRTLCLQCHKKTDTYAGRIFNYIKT